MTRVLPTWAASAWNPRGTVPSQTLCKFLLIKGQTLLSHHTLLRGASIREITLSDIFLYRLASTSSVNPNNQPVVMVIATRNSKTSKDARLQQSYAARHLEAELCAIGETGLWLLYILDQIGQTHGVDFLPPLDTRAPALLQEAPLRRPQRQGAKRAPCCQPPTMDVAVVDDQQGVLQAERARHTCRRGARACHGRDAARRDSRAGSLGTRQDDEISLRFDAEHEVKVLRQMLTYERERTTVEKIDPQDVIEKRNNTIATLVAEVTRLTEALRVSEARRMPEAPPAANEPPPSDGGSADSANTGARAKQWDEKPEKPPQTVDEARYELNVVQPWREAETVRDVWRLWSCTTAEDTRRLCDRITEPGFDDRHTLLAGATHGAHEMKVRRMLKATDAVCLLRPSDGEADTEAVVDALNKIAASGIGTFCDALTVLKPGTGPTYSQEPGMGVKGLSRTAAKLRVAFALVAHNLKTKEWVAALFPDTWEEQMPKAEADMVKQSAAKQWPPTKTPSKRKKTG
ncbi:unnamed protein product [Closterium sp. Naga37s-1]|nr:unnamed protein product [Closterium sp. Naga37s-1]